MSSPAKAKPENLLGLSFSEARLMLLGIICTDNSGKIDFEKLAAIAPYKNVGSASVSYRNAKRKFLDINSKLQGGSATGPATTENQPASTPTPKKTPAKRKKAAAATDSDAATPAGTATTEQEASFPTPTPKRQRKLPAAETTGTMKTTVKMETDGDEATKYSPFKYELRRTMLDAFLRIADTEALMNINIKTEEEEVMTELDVDAEFADMEREWSHPLAKVADDYF